MARIESEGKAGFYATPLEELALIKTNLTVAQEGIVRMYDPCCGEGVALKKLASVFENVVTYGAELEKTRAELATGHLEHVFHLPYQQVRLEPKSMSLLWLNPPYQVDVSGQRTEYIFLKELTDKHKGILQPGGILMFCIPQYVLAQTASILAARFRKIKVYKFAQRFDDFNQIVVVGKFERGSIKEQQEKVKELIKLAEGSHEFLPTLEEMEEIEVPISHFQNESPYFRGHVLDMEEVKADFTHSLLFTEVEKIVEPKGNHVEMKRPLLPLKVTHLGIALAAGAVGGNIGGHIISGMTKQRTDKETLYDDNGEPTSVRLDHHFASIIRAFSNEHGVVDIK